MPPVRLAVVGQQLARDRLGDRLPGRLLDEQPLPGGVDLEEDVAPVGRSAQIDRAVHDPQAAHQLEQPLRDLPRQLGGFDPRVRHVHPEVHRVLGLLRVDRRGEDLVADTGHAQVHVGRHVLLEDHRRVADVLQRRELLLADQPRLAPLLLGRGERLADDVAVAVRVHVRARRGDVVGHQRARDLQADLLGDPQLQQLAVGDLVAPGSLIQNTSSACQSPRIASWVSLTTNTWWSCRRSMGLGAGVLWAPPPGGAHGPQVEPPSFQFKQEDALTAVLAGLVARDHPRAIGNSDVSTISAWPPSRCSSAATAAACSSRS